MISGETNNPKTTRAGREEDERDLEFHFLLRTARILNLHQLMFNRSRGQEGAAERRPHSATCWLALEAVEPFDADMKGGFLVSFDRLLLDRKPSNLH